MTVPEDVSAAPPSFESLSVDEQNALLQAFNNAFSTMGINSVGGLRRIYPANAVYPIYSAEAGINYPMVRSNPRGLLCYLQSFDDMVGYEYRVFLGGRPVATGVITTQGDVMFYISASDIVPGIHDLYANVRRAATGNDLDTPILRVKVDLEAPGGIDPDPSLPGNQNLKLVSHPSVIGESQANNGVDFTIAPWQGMALYDTVVLSVGGHLIEHEISSPSQVGNPVTIRVGREVLGTLDRQANVLVMYSLLDEVKNPSWGWSPSTSLWVELGANQLDPPQIYDPDGSPNMGAPIDLSQVTDLEVEVSALKLIRGDVVQLAWQLTPLQGAPQTGTLSLTVVRPSQALVFLVPGDETVRLNPGRFSASYTVNGNRSLRAEVELFGTPAEVDQFPAPELENAPDGLLFPIRTPQGGTLFVRYASMSAQDRITVRFPAPAGAPVIAEQPGNGSGTVPFFIPVEYLAAGMGTTVTVTYEVRRAGQVLYSQPLRLEIRRLIVEHLPIPYIPQTNGSVVLDLSTFAGNALLKVDPWALMAQGQLYWLYVTWTPRGGAATTRLLTSGTVQAGEVGQVLSKTLLRSDLEALNPNSEIRFSFRVAFSGERESDAQLFPDLRVVVLGMVPPVPQLSLGGAHTQAVSSSYIIYEGRPPLRPHASAGATYARSATGGVPPYRYSSNNGQVALVDASTGLVRATGNGTARIAVVDQRGSRASYSISFSGVRRAYVEWNLWWSPNFSDPVRKKVESCFNSTELVQLWRQYQTEGAVGTLLGVGPLCWTRENILTNDHAWAFQLDIADADNPARAKVSRQGGTKLPGFFFR